VALQLPGSKSRAGKPAAAQPQEGSAVKEPFEAIEIRRIDWKAEKEGRERVYAGVRSRIDGSHRTAAAGPKGLRPSGLAAKHTNGVAIGQARDVSPEALTAIYSGAEVVSAVRALYEMRRAAILAHRDPERLPEARGKLLLAVADVWAFVYSVSSITHPIVVIGVIAVTSGAKLLNAAYKVIASSGGGIAGDPMLSGARKIAEAPVMKQMLNLLLKAVYYLDSRVTGVLDPLRDNFTKGASARERSLGEQLLRQYIKAHNQYLPNQKLTEDALRKRLTSPDSKEDLCVVKCSDQVVGGFVCDFESDERRKVLYITSVVPPAEADVTRHALVCQQIIDYANLYGITHVRMPSQAVARAAA
jgi:hypothetical protein